jgi:hypothetical protein
MLGRLRSLGAIGFVVALGSCASVDQFGARVSDANNNTNFSSNAEMLLNIVRASVYQSASFLTITQISGGQTETLTTGLPTINLGPTQTAAQHVYSIANSVASGVTGGYQGNPLATTDFQEAMLAPISGRWLADLIRSHPRQAVLFTSVENITLSKSAAPGRTLVFKNDPTDNYISYTDGKGNYDPGGCAAAYKGFGQFVAKDAVKWFADEGICNFTKFETFVKVGWEYGLTFDYVTPAPKPAPTPTASPSPAASGNKTQGGSTTTAAEGELCFDPGLAIPSYRSGFSGIPTCGVPHSGKAKPFPFYFGPGIGSYDITVGVRSPNGVIAFLGKLLRDGTGDQIKYDTLDPYSELTSSGNFLEIVQGAGPNCSVSVTYAGAPYCVPSSAYNTAILLDMLVQLKNLATTATDLGTSFTFRLSN